ncbi:MAG: entericidin EcnA/B family protein [Marinovum sp.]|nr:entericidin EcnA/B family protein [Marinovum sp.]
MKKSKLLATLTVVSLALAGCATVQGIGRDISAGAERASTWF